MSSVQIFIETSPKKTFAGAIHWPGWCRSGKDENAAIETLFEYRLRYKQVLKARGIDFSPPSNLTDFSIVEKVEGNSTTAFGAPAILLKDDLKWYDHSDLERWENLLHASWMAFDQAVALGKGKELRKGPRGGGRDLEKILHHILEADKAYLNRLAWKQTKNDEADISKQISLKRREIIKALTTAVTEGLPEKGPRGGLIWPIRFFVRRVVWHVLDHTWEIEDRIM